jgi:hypothetical protein
MLAAVDLNHRSVKGWNELIDSLRFALESKYRIIDYNSLID